MFTIIISGVNNDHDDIMQQISRKGLSIGNVYVQFMKFIGQKVI